MKKIKPEPFDHNRCVERNEQVARERYGSRLTEDRRVGGTDIWFDEGWRIHTGYTEKEGK